MRFGFLFSGVFWGTMLILLGISIILKVVFNISIPFFRLFFAFFFVYLGLQILIGRPPHAGDRRTVVFGGRTVRADERNAEYHAVFGRGVFDLSGVDVSSGTVRASVNTVFGAGEVLLDPSMPVIVHGSAVFGEASFPDGGSAVFGEHTYRSPSYDPSRPHLSVRVTVVFGGLRIRHR